MPPTTDAPTGRTVRWSEAAVDDLRWWGITKAEWRVIRAEVERVAKLNNVRLDRAVCSIAQCNHEWDRLKITHPSQIRVAFSSNERSLVVQAVCRRRENTYSFFELFWKAA